MEAHRLTCFKNDGTMPAAAPGSGALLARPTPRAAAPGLGMGLGPVLGPPKTSGKTSRKRSSSSAYCSQ